MRSKEKQRKKTGKNKKVPGGRLWLGTWAPFFSFKGHYNFMGAVVNCQGIIYIHTTNDKQGGRLWPGEITTLTRYT